MDAVQSLVMVQASGRPPRLDSVSSRPAEDSWDSLKHTDALPNAFRLATPTATDAFDALDEWPTLVPSAQSRRLTSGAATRAQERNVATRLIGSNLGKEFTDILSETQLRVPLQA